MEFLINTITHWDEPPRARHQVAYALAKNHRVVFVAANRVGFPGIKTHRERENLTVVQPFFIFGNKIRYRLPFFNEIYQNWLFRKLRKEYAGFRVINFDFTATRIYRFFNHVIFYYNDNLAAMSKRLNPVLIARYHERAEAKVAAKAKFCVSVSSILKDKLKAFNAESYEIPLGGPDLSDFNISFEESISTDRPIKVGLVGFISAFSISADVLNLILKQENMELIVIGPVEDSFRDQLENRERMVLKGTLTGEELFQEINKFDIAVTPYCDAFGKNDNIGVGTGNKMYQYLALGKPVVISNMVGLRQVSLPEKFLYIAMEDSDFPPLIEKAFKENSIDARNQRIAFARENTWEKRMEELIKIYNEHE